MKANKVRTNSIEAYRRKRNLLTIFDLNSEEILLLIQRAEQMKRVRGAVTSFNDALRGRSVALIFEKPSTRTRISFEVGVYQLGGQPLFISSEHTQLKRGEPLKDTARVLSRYTDMIIMRTFSQKNLVELAKYASVPVINGLSDFSHPCQVLSDLLTVCEYKVENFYALPSAELLRRMRNLKFAWIGDGNNVAHSWIEACGVLGLQISVACPKGYQPDKSVVRRAIKLGGRIHITTKPAHAVRRADVVSTDVWASMGQEREKAERLRHFKGFCVDSKLLGGARKDVIFMHCLPAHRGEEVSNEVIEGSQSVVWDQAENRLHMQKALMEFLINVSGGGG